MKTVTVVNDYEVAPNVLWDLVTDYDALAEVMAGIATFSGLPKGRTITGQKIDVMVSMFGKLPNQRYFMEVIECDDDGMVLRSSEHGAGVKSWRHTLHIISTANGCRMIDSIDIDAGIMTSIFALWARYMYTARHKPRLRMLGFI
jgi:ligand-binding SRPBCC domain-containing protein